MRVNCTGNLTNDPGTVFTHHLKVNIMNAEHKRGKGPVVIYRKDGKTPDLRYKSSREYVLSQELEKNKNAQKDWKTTDLKYKGLRDHVLSKHTEINRQIPVQIKPVGKKPIWKTSG